MALNNTKFAFLKRANINAKIADGSLDEYDYIATTDTKELYYLDKNKVAQRIQSRIKVFTTMASALENLGNDSTTYPGEIIVVNNAPYIVTQDTNGYKLSDLANGLLQVENKLALPTFGNEKVMYYVKTTKEIYVWNGASYDIVVSANNDWHDIQIIDGGDAVTERKEYD